VVWVDIEAGVEVGTGVGFGEAAAGALVPEARVV
jgi:hypothetical protein